MPYHTWGSALPRSTPGFTLAPAFAGWCDKCPIIPGVPRCRAPPQALLWRPRSRAGVINALSYLGFRAAALHPRLTLAPAFAGWCDKCPIIPGVPRCRAPPQAYSGARVRGLEFDMRTPQPDFIPNSTGETPCKLV